jgi:hypothetical protein
LIVADHDCIYWLYLYGPDLLYPNLLLYYTLHPTTKVAIQCKIKHWMIQVECEEL